MKLSYCALKILFKQSRALSIGIVLYVFISALLTSAQLLAVQGIVESISASNQEWRLILSILFLVLVGVFDANQESIESIFNIEINNFLMRKVMPTILEKQMRLSYDTLSSPKTHDLLQRMSKSPEERMLRNIMAWIQLLRSIVSMVGLIIYFFSFSFVLAISFFVLISSLSWSNFSAIRMINEVLILQCPEERKLDYYGKLLSEKDSLYELSVFGAVKTLILRYYELAKQLYKIRLQRTMKGQIWMAVSYILLALWIAFVVIWSTNAVTIGSISIGLMISLISASVQIASLADRLGTAYSRVLFTSIDVICYESFMNLAESETSKSEKEQKTCCFCTTITMQDVTYIYPGTDKKVLNHLSLKINLQQRAALVGKNGAGKSTIVKLLCGLIEPTEGIIYYGDIPMNEIAIEARRQFLAVMFQDYVHYPLTLRENIALGNIEKATDTIHMKEALEQAGVEFSLEDLDIPLSKNDEDGIDLSGGQWQRIAIARALFSPARYFLLDEPTAALDPIAESHMYENFMRILENKGASIISHRMASARMADYIFVLDKGKIIEEGTHEQLIEENGEYSNMYLTQAKWYQEVNSDEEN